MRSNTFSSQFNRKSKTWFFTFLNVYVSWIERDKILISQLTRPKFKYFVDQNEQKEDPIKMIFYNFEIQQWISQIVRAQKVDVKIRIICLISFSTSWVMVLKLSKILNFLQIFADISKKPKSIKASYFDPSESLRLVLSYNCVFYRHLSNKY